MHDIDTVVRYLGSASFQEAALEARAAPQPFITISRQAGAQGLSLARAIVAEMAKERKLTGDPTFKGWHVYDRKLCELVAADPKLSVYFESLVKETFHSDFEDYIAHLLSGTSPQAAVIHKMFHAVRSVARVGKAVIVGRAGS